MSNYAHVTYDYRGASVLVTGGTAGIGAGIAKAYKDAGAHVTITGTRSSPSEYDEDLSGYQYRSLDVLNNEQIDQLAASTQQVDILVNNAGANFMVENEYDPEIFDKSVQVNLLSA